MGSSPAYVHDDLVKRRFAKEPSVVPSVRTISEMAAELRPDDSGAWTLEDTSDPAAAKLLFRILNVVARASRGRITGFTKREARLLPVIFVAGRPRYSAWSAFLWTRFYIRWVQTENDARDVVLFFASLPGNSRDLKKGDEVTQKKGSWPLTAWLSVQRVGDAVEAWQELPDVKEEIEVTE